MLDLAAHASPGSTRQPSRSRHRFFRASVSSSSSRAAWCSPRLRRSEARLLAEVRVLGWSSPSTRRRRARVSSSRSRARLRAHPGCAGQRARLLAEVQGVGVVVAEDPAVAGQGVFVQFPCRLVLTQHAQVDWRDCWPRSGCLGWSSPSIRRLAGQGVFAEFAGCLVLAERAAGRWRGCWRMSRYRGGPRPRTRRPPGESVFAEIAGCLMVAGPWSDRWRGCWPSPGSGGGRRRGRDAGG